MSLDPDLPGVARRLAQASVHHAVERGAEGRKVHDRPEPRLGVLGAGAASHHGRWRSPPALAASGVSVLFSTRPGGHARRQRGLSRGGPGHPGGPRLRARRLHEHGQARGPSDRCEASRFPRARHERRRPCHLRLGSGPGRRRQPHPGLSRGRSRPRRPGGRNPAAAPRPRQDSAREGRRQLAGSRAQSGLATGDAPLLRPVWGLLRLPGAEIRTLVAAVPFLGNKTNRSVDMTQHYDWLRGVALFLTLGAVATGLGLLSMGPAWSDEEYVIGVDDVLHIQGWDNKDLDQNVTVRPDGRISFPLVGEIRASGLTSSQLAELLSTQLGKWVKNPNVSVVVREIRSLRVFFFGQVTRPGVYPIKPGTPVLRALPIAGGLAPGADLSAAYIVRDNQRIPVDLRRLVQDADLSQNIPLR